MSMRLLAAGVSFAAMSVLAAPAAAQSLPAVRYDLPAQDLEASLRAVGRQSGRQIIIAAGALDGKRARELHGEYTPEQAVHLLVENSGVSVRVTDAAILVGQAGISAEDADIMVIGSRIRGGTVAAPVTILRGEDAALDGKHSVAELMATVPQNFGGGQNPGNGPGIPGSANETGAASFNLRGLGSDATLTLIDGHRVSYGGQSQSVDISTIPFLALDRLEVVADGGSALYGSDAVAGVANVILRRDFEGLQVSAGAAFPTDGGGVTQQYGAIAGTSWASGSVYAAYEYSNVDAISSNDRAFSRSLAPNTSLYPALEHNNVMAKLRQDLTPSLKFELTGFYNKRTSVQFAAYDRVNDYRANGQIVTSRDESLAIMPTLSLAVGAGWNIAASGSYAQDHAAYTNKQRFAGADYLFNTCFCNGTTSAEINADGPLLHLPAGPVRLAVGAGYRSSRFNKTDARIEANQENHFAYGELEVPLVSPDQAVAGVRRLTINLAGRYENYRRVGTVVTPKLGMVYTPFEGLDLKASWGSSFRAPTLFQLYNNQLVALYNVTTLGLTGAPPNATAMVFLGGNPDLKPEKAKTLVLTADWRPAPGAHLEISYFNIRYRDRIVTPITYLSQALIDPGYAAYVSRNPSDADKGALVALGPLSNASGRPYDASTVLAIVRNTNVNAQRQKVHGVDLAADYTFSLGSGQLTLLGTGSYIDSTQQISADQAVTQLAGTLYRPAHLRGRLGARYASDRFTISTSVNHVGSVKDTRLATAVSISGQTTIDLALTWRPKLGGLLENLQATVWAQNLNNDLPQYVRQTVIGYSPYDPTNYSAIGRQIGFTISNRW
jgi:iron complex outermembrane recepter protein